MVVLRLFYVSFYSLFDIFSMLSWNFGNFMTDKLKKNKETPPRFQVFFPDVILWVRLKKVFLAQRPNNLHIFWHLSGSVPCPFTWWDSYCYLNSLTCNQTFPLKRIFTGGGQVLLFCFCSCSCCEDRWFPKPPLGPTFTPRTFASTWSYTQTQRSPGCTDLCSCDVCQVLLCSHSS